MNSRTIYIIATLMLTLTLAACSSAIEPEEVSGDATCPLGFSAISDVDSRASTEALDGNKFVVYGAALYDNSDLIYYYSYDYTAKREDRLLSYVEVDGYNLFRFTGNFYPMQGTMRFMVYGMTKSIVAGKRIRATFVPGDDDPQLAVLRNYEYMALNLNGDYDGSYEVIAADRRDITCTTSMTVDVLPVLNFHHIQAHLSVEFTAANADVCNRVRILSITVPDAPYKGVFKVRNTVADGEWTDVEGEAKLPLSSYSFNGSMKITTGNGLYIIPQDRKKIIINYSIYNGPESAGLYDNKYRRVLNYVIEPPAGSKWLPGYRYKYQVSVKPMCDMNLNNVEVELFQDKEVGATNIGKD